MKKTNIIIAFMLLLLTSSCGNVQNEFSSNRCYFIFENSKHNNPRLAEAMTPYSGMFCTISLVTENGAQYYSFTNSSGLTKKAILTDLDKQRTHILGLNNGLIVGYGKLSDPLTFYAYDLECPNCFDPDAIPVRSKKLSVSTSGIATCNVCKRQYDLNNGGIITSGDKGNKLTRYHASTTGAYGILTVN
jgi:hypothetical protein